MTLKARSIRFIGALGAAALVAGMLALPAAATPPDPNGEHTVTICHVTNSDGNPYVEITVDVAAFDGDDNNDHAHHVAKDGRTDFELQPGESCPASIVTTTLPPSTTTSSSSTTSTTIGT